MASSLTSVTVPMRCAICGRDVAVPVDSTLPSVPLGRIRICRTCRRVVCRGHSERVAKDEFVCVECGRAGQ